MTEAGNATVIPFVHDDEDIEDHDDRFDNPAERLQLAETMRMAEAIVFASSEPVSERALAQRLPAGAAIGRAM